MNRFLRILLALLVAIGAMGAELPPSRAVRMDCGGACPCGMPAQPCETSAPAPLGTPSRVVAVVAEHPATVERWAREPKPWPAEWAPLPRSWNTSRMTFLWLSVDTGPPLLASERAAQLEIFRI